MRPSRPYITTLPKTHSDKISLMSPSYISVQSLQRGCWTVAFPCIGLVRS